MSANYSLVTSLVLSTYLDQLYNDSHILMNIHFKSIDSTTPIHIQTLLINDQEIDTTNIHDIRDYISYILYANALDANALTNAYIEYTYGSITYAIHRTTNSLTIHEINDNHKYPVINNNYILDVFGPCSNPMDISIYTYWLDSLDAWICDSQHHTILALSHEKDQLEHTIQSNILDSNSLRVTYSVVNDVERTFHEYNRLTRTYTRELKRYRTGSEDGSIDSTMDNATVLLALKKRIHLIRYIPDEYRMIKNRLELVRTIDSTIEHDKMTIQNIDTKIEYERKIYNQQWIDADVAIYKHTLQTLTNHYDNHN
jgi:hypothetical protein